MTEVSCTITGGIGSEKHNHDLDYREGLDHTNTADCPDAIIELVPYKASYQEQIDALMKPYIDDYNAHQKEKWDAAWEKYRAGERKSKPKKKDFPMMDYGYYEAHKDDTIINPHTKKVEQIPIFRSWIIGIGDITDRKDERITREQAELIFREFMEKFKEKFPHFHILGATIHLDEEGFFHMHLDYKPVMARKFSKGLQATTSQDTILESMGYKPEQSIINGRDKAPILFNALRNQMYYDMESAMANHELRLQYGVSAMKQPGHDSGKNMDMDSWQAAQDAVRDMQHRKNIMLDAIAEGDTPEGIGEAIYAAEQLNRTMKMVEQSPKSRIDKGKRIVEFRLLDQLKSWVDKLMDAYHFVITRMEEFKKKYMNAELRAIDAEARADSAEAEIERLQPFERRYNALTVDHRNALERMRKAEAEVARQRNFMAQFRVGDKSIDELCQEAKRRAQKEK